MKKLNIGCGSDWKLHNGFIGMDICDLGQKHVADVLGKKGVYRFNDDEFDLIMAKHFLEHLNQKNVIYVLNQVHRILKRGGMFKVCVPHKEHEWAYVLDHKTFWTESTFRWLERKDIESVYKIKRWKIDWMNTNERMDIHCYLKPVK